MKKSVAATWRQCAVRNAFQIDGRSGAGFIPFAFSTFAMVVEATLCPSAFSCPWIRQ